MRSLATHVLLAMLLAGGIAWFAPARTVDQQLLHLQLTQLDPELAVELEAQPVALQALMSVYAHDAVLLAKARLALWRHPRAAVPVLLAYGEQAPFQEVLRRYGEDVVLPIQYFRDHEIQSLAWRHAVGSQTQEWLLTVRRWWGDGADAAPDSGASTPEASASGVVASPGAGPSPAPDAGTKGVLTPDERGRYAIAFLAAEGYDFLGQFVADGDGQPQWVQTERLLEGVNSLLAGGVRNLETQWRSDAPIGVADLGWAALDVAVGVAAFKLLRAGRGASASRGVGVVGTGQRSAVVAAPLWRASALGMRLAKYGAPAVLAYVAIRHPSVLNAMFGELAAALGLPKALGQWLGWTLVALPVLWLLGWLLGPLAWVLRQLATMLNWLAHEGRGRRRGEV